MSAWGGGPTRIDKSRRNRKTEIDYHIETSMKLTGAQILWECLVREGVTDIFGYPGGAILPAYDAMLDYPIRHVLVRHEQGATHMADGYARASGGVGVAIATSGPGATNMVTGIATAMLDSSPIVCITGQVGSRLIGSDAFQEIDITGITLPVTKHNYLVTRADDVAKAVREAFVIAKSGRPGPVQRRRCLAGGRPLKHLKLRSRTQRQSSTPRSGQSFSPGTA
jgi:glyoxylate carboligase